MRSELHGNSTRDSHSYDDRFLTTCITAAAISKDDGRLHIHNRMPGTGPVTASPG